MRRFAIPALVTLAAVALVALLVFGVLQTNSSHTSIDEAVAKGQRPVAHDASLPLLGGGMKRLADYRGKVVVLNFFAHWCPPCRDEAPMLSRMQARIAPRGATILGVAWDDTTDKVQWFVDKFGVTYPVVSDTDAKFGAAYGIRGMPETFVLDRRGRIAAVFRGPLDNDRWLTRQVDRLLAEPQQS